MAIKHIDQYHLEDAFINNTKKWIKQKANDSEKH